MYAIIKTKGNKQRRVEVGDVIDVDLLDVDVGAHVAFEEVLLACDGSQTHVGQPCLSDFFVYGEVLGRVSGEKVTGLKYKPSHNECRKWGHRQPYTRVKIVEIGLKRHNNEERHHGA